MTKEGMQSPVIAVAILLIGIGLFAFFAVLLGLASASPSRNLRPTSTLENHWINERRLQWQPAHRTSRTSSSSGATISAVATSAAILDGLMGYQTPNIDRVAKEGMIFTDYYAEQSCTAGRASFITGQHGLRTGLDQGRAARQPRVGLRKEDPTIAELLKPQGYATARSARTTSVTATSSCRPCTGSTSSTATCTT